MNREQELQHVADRIARGITEGVLRVVEAAPASNGEMVIVIRLAEDIEESLMEWVRA